MEEIRDIGYFELALSLLLFGIPIVLLVIFRIKLTGAILTSALRMLAQLFLVGLYLELIFELNSAWLNITWVIVMVLVGAVTTIGRAGLNWRIFILPLFISGITTIFIIDAFFLGFIIELEYVFDARYFIPITGMILGNSLNHNIVGLRAYFSGLDEKSDMYYFLLTNTGSPKLALRPFINDAVSQALNPLIATMAVIGLISLPGMMTGQILGGSPPLIAIKYQVMIMVAIFVGCTLNLFLSMLLSNRFVFDRMNMIRNDMLSEKKNT